MSEDPRVELIRQGFASWEDDDVEATLALCDPEVEVYAPPEIGNAGTFHGIDGFLEWTQAWYEAWETFRQEVLSIEPFGTRHATVRVNQSGEGKGSGVAVERAATWVCEVRDGKLAYMALFFDHDHAVALALEREASD